ncbi:MAG: hypothetical protein M5U34_17360 [Chloroflexi bacterium]|nr:hypothetical protein [Chloroflexota bacterium]
MQVIVRRTAPTLESGSLGLNDLHLLCKGMYDAGAAPILMAGGAHTASPSQEGGEGPDLLNFRRVELLREIMVANNDALKTNLPHRDRLE